MATENAPSAPLFLASLVDRGGMLTQEGLAFLEGVWKQIVAGYVIVPCVASTDTDAITLSPRMHKEGGATYADHMAFSFVADADSAGPVTIGVGGLPQVNAYIDGGATQANAGDVLTDRLYLVLYNSLLDTGNGGFVLK